MRVCDYHKQDNKSVLDLPTPLELFKEEHTAEEYDELVAFYSSDEWKEIEREHFNSDRPGISAIAKQLNAKGIKSPEYFSHRKISATRTKLCKKYLWVQTSVKRILENEIYTGTLVNHKTVTSKIYKTKSTVPAEEQFRHENYLPAIIDKQTFEQAQLLLENHKQGNVRASAFRKIHRYCSMIKCAECGAILIAKHRVCKNNEWVEYTCNSHHRYGKEYCTLHRIHESQLDEVIYDEVRLLLIRIQEQSKKYDKIVRDWQRQKPAYERKIEQYKERIASLRQQIEDLIIERISDREHASFYNNMITKREEEIADLQK